MSGRGGFGNMGDLLRWPRPAASTMADETISAEIAILEAQFDRFRADLEDCGHGGSPGEWMVERLDELETERRRRGDA